MQIDDIFEIANGINNSLLMLNEKSINNRNIKKCLTIGLQLPIEELQQIDRDFYVMQNGKSEGFTASEEIRVKIMGIDFVIIPEEEEEA